MMQLTNIILLYGQNPRQSVKMGFLFKSDPVLNSTFGFASSAGSVVAALSEAEQRGYTAVVDVR